jgi:hypothetical protein
MPVRKSLSAPVYNWKPTARQLENEAKELEAKAAIYRMAADALRGNRMRPGPEGDTVRNENGEATR